MNDESAGGDAKSHEDYYLSLFLILFGNKSLGQDASYLDLRDWCKLTNRDFSRFQWLLQLFVPAVDLSL